MPPPANTAPPPNKNMILQREIWLSTSFESPDDPIYPKDSDFHFAHCLAEDSPFTAGPNDAEFTFKELPTISIRHTRN
ncbi:hypothetical protein CDAR_121611 [Caerostris darwini]|uniref:Uncharacterized protein n=1 Tax=Caerostris darwini TaxID=1538125 RepID=A0AAV4V961_9ARAC|nr:hypothetical protein CDAR_121611 [Caerostris darwini]